MHAALAQRAQGGFELQLEPEWMKGRRFGPNWCSVLRDKTPQGNNRRHGVWAESEHRVNARAAVDLLRTFGHPVQEVRIVAERSAARWLPTTGTLCRPT